MNLTQRLSGIISQRRILYTLTAKNLKSKYVGSLLGIFWAILNPLLLMLAITFVNTKIMKTDVKSFPLFVLSALLPWFFFANTVYESAGSLEKNRDMLNQFILQKELIPISITFANFINFLLGFIVIFPFFVIFNVKVLGNIAYIPLIMIMHFMFTLGLSFLFSIANIYFKDMAQVLNIGMMFLFWVTPVFYQLEGVAKQYYWFIMINPCTCYVDIYRSLLYQASPGNISMWLLALGFGLISVIGGFVLFAKKEREVLKYV
jgi:lipopolysaccharide transport system permease protein